MVEKIGMSEKRAMEISGPKTRSWLERYHIVSFADIQESGQKMDKWMKAQRTQPVQELAIMGTKKRKSSDPKFGRLTRG